MAGERFDLIVTNPPYVMSPPTGERLVYREGIHDGDGLVEQLVRRAPDVLTDGGTAQLLANWAHVRGQDWTERLAGWIAGTGCDAHVVQREVLDAAAYVELWLADAGLAGSPAYLDRYAAWLDYFERPGHRGGRDGLDRAAPSRSRRAPDPARGLAVRDRAADRAGVRRRAPGRPARRTPVGRPAARPPWRLADDVIEETQGRPGAADPSTSSSGSSEGSAGRSNSTPPSAAVLGACDGDLALSRLIEAVADLLQLDVAALTTEVVPRIRALSVDGFVAPAIRPDALHSDQS